MQKNTQECPVCRRNVEFSITFPNYVCNTCAAAATDAQGETVIFYHTHIASTGYQGYYRRNKELIPFAGNTCFISGVKCVAIYDHLGAVVLIPEGRSYEITGRQINKLVGNENRAVVG